MATSLDALGNDDVDASPCGRYRIRNRADLMKNSCACCMRAIRIRRWIAPEKRKHRNAFFETDRNEVFTRKMKNEIDAKRLLSQFAHPLKLAAEQRRRAKLSLENSKSAGVSNRRNQLWACEIRTRRCSDERILNSQCLAQFRRHASGVGNALARARATLQ